MMHPDPSQRPSTSNLLRHTRVQRAVWRGHWRRLTRGVVREGRGRGCGFTSCLLQSSAVQWVMVPLYRPVLLLLVYLLSWWRGQAAVESASPPPPPPFVPPFIGVADDSFSGTLSFPLSLLFPSPSPPSFSLHLFPLLPLSFTILPPFFFHSLTLRLGSQYVALPRRLHCRAASIDFLSMFVAGRDAARRNGAMRHNCEPVAFPSVDLLYMCMIIITQTMTIWWLRVF